MRDHLRQKILLNFVIDDLRKSSSRYNTIDVNDIIVDSCNGLMSSNVKVDARGQCHLQ